MSQKARGHCSLLTPETSDRTRSKRSVLETSLLSKEGIPTVQEAFTLSTKATFPLPFPYLSPPVNIYWEHFNPINLKKITNSYGQ
jgi:hypothetical protein